MSVIFEVSIWERGRALVRTNSGTSAGEEMSPIQGRVLVRTNSGISAGEDMSLSQTVGPRK